MKRLESVKKMVDLLDVAKSLHP